MKLTIDLNKVPVKIAENIKNLEQDLPIEIKENGVRLEIEKSNVFVVERKGESAKIFYTVDSEIYLGIKYLFINGEDFSLQRERKMDNLDVMIDCSRNAVKNVTTVKKLIRMLAVSGYQSLMLYTEDTYEVDGEPYFGYLRGRYTKAELKEIDAYALSYGIELIPCIQTLAHLKTLRILEDGYNEIFDNDDVLLVGEEKTYALLDNIFKTVKECFSTKKINIGMDEAQALGRGKYLDQNGYEPSSVIMRKHLSRVMEIANKYGFEPCMWSDMFFRCLSKTMDYYNLEPITQDVYDTVPENMKLIYWEYRSEDVEHYKTHIDRHQSFNREVWFAGSGISSYRFTTDNEQGIKYMSISFDACVQKGVKTYIVTYWGDNGGESSIFSMLSSLVKMGSLNCGDTDEEYEKTLVALCGLTRKEFSTIYLQKDKYLFYNDCFAGIYDTAIDFGEREKYTAQIPEIEKAIQKATGETRNIFRTKKYYYEAMSLKCELGIQTRKVYKSKDKKALEALIDVYAQTIDKIRIFYESFRADWLRENKAYGFEIQAIRIGGLLRRLEDCKVRLTDLLKGNITEIEELEVELLDYASRVTVTHQEYAGNSNYMRAVSVNNL